MYFKAVDTYISVYISVHLLTNISSTDCSSRQCLYHFHMENQTWGTKVKHRKWWTHQHSGKSKNKVSYFFNLTRAGTDMNYIICTFTLFLLTWNCLYEYIYKIIEEMKALITKRQKFREYWILNSNSLLNIWS